MLDNTYKNIFTPVCFWIKAKPCWDRNFHRLEAGWIRPKDLLPHVTLKIEFQRTYIFVELKNCKATNLVKVWLDNDRRTNICSKVIWSVLKWIWKNISNWSRTHLCLTFDNIFFDKVMEIQYVKFLSVLFWLYLHAIKQHCWVSKQVGVRTLWCWMPRIRKTSLISYCMWSVMNTYRVSSGLKLVLIFPVSCKKCG